MVRFRNSKIKLTITRIAKKNNVYGEPQVIVANGAQPKSVIERLMPVDLTKAFSAG